MERSTDALILRAVQMVTARKGRPVALYVQPSTSSLYGALLFDYLPRPGSQDAIRVGTFTWNDAIVTLRDALLRALEELTARA